jgi:hypothetical protein
MSGRLLKTGSETWNDERMKKVADILHTQAKKEDEISNKMKNYIRAVVYGSQQIHNFNYSINGEVGNSLKDGDIVVLIDLSNNRVLMKKTGYEPISFDLVNRTVVASGIIFNTGSGEIKGISDEIDIEHMRTDFTVSERVVGNILIDVNMVKDKIDEIIQLLNDIEGMITLVQEDINYSRVTILEQVVSTETKIIEQLNGLQSAIDNATEEIIDEIDSSFSDLNSKIDIQ